MGQARTQGALVPAALLVLTGAVAVASTFLPWLRTGSVTRSSYQVVQAADRLEVVSGAPRVALAVGWAFLPLVAALGLLALTLGRVRMAASAGFAVGLAISTLAVLVKSAPRSGDAGATVGLASGLTLLAAASATAWTTRRR